MVGFIFATIYTPSPDGNPFAFAVPYCNGTQPNFFGTGNASVVRANYAIFYNHSAEIAILFGCDPNNDNGYPLASPGAICAKQSVLACILLNLYRFLAEAVDVLERTACYLSELVQFDGTKATFKDINTTRLWRSYINLGECVRQLLYLLDVLNLGDPAGQPCEYAGPSFKRSLACGFGNLLKAVWLAIGSLAYELLRLIQTLLTSFALPSYGSSIRIPTFTDALNDVEVATCEIGVIIGAIFPLTFNCSSQVRVPLSVLYYHLLPSLFGRA